MSFGYARKAIREAINRGADQVEVRIYLTRGRRMLLENNRLTYFEAPEYSNAVIMAVGSKKIGVARCNGLNEKIILDTVDKAVASMKAAAPDPDFETLLQYSGPYPTVEVYDKRVVEVSSEELVEICREAVETVKENHGTIAQGEIYLGEREEILLNSEGVEAKGRSTRIDFNITLYVSSDTSSSEGFIRRGRRFLEDLNLREDLEKLLEQTRLTLNPRKVEGGVVDVILGPDAVEDLFLGPLSVAINGDNIRKGRSAFLGKIGAEVASAGFTLIDDGLLNRGYRSSPFDGEGYPCRRKIVIEKGVFKEMLLDNYTALKLGRSSTGNAGLTRPPPSVTPTNLIVAPGTATLEEMIREVRKGIYLPRATATFVNPVTGAFSAELRQALKIENGEIRGPVRWGMLSGNVFEMLKKIYLIGKKQEKLSDTITPPILVKGVAVEA
ncbi:MAG: hypothetical protein DRJ47_01745 [Thermoprotei archaeon]|nr:MAG: hypothetical protein DRJ47_01745 [Thermoprotei archaeon]